MADPSEIEALELLDELFAYADGAVAPSSRLRDQIRGRVASILDEETARKLREVPASALKPLLPKGARFGALQGTRLRTVQDLAGVSAAEIGAVPGIGMSTAEAIHREAVSHRSRTRQSVRLRINHRTRCPRKR